MKIKQQDFSRWSGSPMMEMQLDYIAPQDASKILQGSWHQPKQGTIKGKSPKCTIHFAFFDHCNIGNLCIMTPVWYSEYCIYWNSSRHSWLPSLFPLVLTNTLGIPSMCNLCDQDLLWRRKNMEKLRTRRKLQQIFLRRKWTSLILKNPLMVDIPCRGLEKNTG